MAATVTNATTKKYQPIYTKEKALHLIRVYLGILSIMFLLGWTSAMIQLPLKREQQSMGSMDPSEIIATPFSLQKTALFTMPPVLFILAFWMFKDSKSMSTNVIGLIKWTLALYALMALCGQNMITNWRHSLLSALYMASLLSTTWIAKTDDDKKNKITATTTTKNNMLEELPFSDFSNILATCRLYGMIAVSIPFQLLSVLDHGAQMQRWPLPVLLGGTYGYIIGTFCGLVVLYLQSKTKRSD